MIKIVNDRCISTFMWLQFLVHQIKFKFKLTVDDCDKPPYWESEIFPTVSSYIDPPNRERLLSFCTTLLKAIDLKSSRSVHGTDFGIPNTLFFSKP